MKIKFEELEVLIGSFINDQDEPHLAANKIGAILFCILQTHMRNITVAPEYLPFLGKMWTHVIDEVKKIEPKGKDEPTDITPVE